MCLEAVKKDGNILQYVKNQTLELCVEAVKNNEHSIRFVKNQTPEYIWLVQNKYRHEHNI